MLAAHWCHAKHFCTYQLQFSSNLWGVLLSSLPQIWQVRLTVRGIWAGGSRRPVRGCAGLQLHGLASEWHVLHLFAPSVKPGEHGWHKGFPLPPSVFTIIIEYWLPLPQHDFGVCDNPQMYVFSYGENRSHDTSHKHFGHIWGQSPETIK